MNGATRETPGSDAWLLRDLIDRRPELNAVALRPGQGVHVHALERVLALLEDIARLRTGKELEAMDGSPRPVTALDVIVGMARERLGK